MVYISCCVMKMGDHPYASPYEVARSTRYIKEHSHKLKKMRAFLQNARLCVCSVSIQSDLISSTELRRRLIIQQHITTWKKHEIG